MTLGTIECVAAFFQSPHCKTHFYVVGLHEMDYIEFLQKYCLGDIDCKRATGLRMDDTNDKFFMCFVSDCFDPPIAIIRADNEQDAEEWFVDELSWSHYSEDDVKKMTEEEQEYAGYGPSGQVYDQQNLQVQEVKLIRVELTKR